MSDSMEPSSTFHPFPLLPIELRLKIWLYSITPRNVSLSARNVPRDSRNVKIQWDPEECPVDCTEHTISPDQIPSILLTCQESRSFGLEMYTQISSPMFRTSWVNLKIDTLVMSKCHHRLSTRGGIIQRGAVDFMTKEWDTERSVLSRLVTENIETAKEVKSLAVCVCEIYNRGISTAPNFDELVEILMKYKSLEELVFLQTEEDLEIRVRSMNLGQVTRRSTLIKRMMGNVYDLEIGLTLHSGVQESSWKMPRIRHFVTKQGVFIQEGQMSQSEKEKAMRYHAKFFHAPPEFR